MKIKNEKKKKKKLKKKVKKELKTKNEKKMKKIYEKSNVTKAGNPKKKRRENPVAHARTQGFNITNILYYYSNPNNPVVILRFAISSDSADRGRSIIRVTTILVRKTRGKPAHAHAITSGSTTTAHPQALVSFKKYMPPPLPYFKVSICTFPLPHFASIFFAYL